MEHICSEQLDLCHKHLWQRPTQLKVFEIKHVLTKVNTSY